MGKGTREKEPDLFCSFVMSLIEGFHKFGISVAIFREKQLVNSTILCNVGILRRSVKHRYAE